MPAMLDQLFNGVPVSYGLTSCTTNFSHVYAFRPFLIIKPLSADPCHRPLSHT